MPRRLPIRGFTLIELLVVIAIIAVLTDRAKPSSLKNATLAFRKGLGPARSPADSFSAAPSIPALVPPPARIWPLCLVLVHCNMINSNSDFDGGLDDPSSFHPGGANILFADGSVRFLKSVLRNLGTNPDGSIHYSPSSLIFQALGTRVGGEVVGSDTY